MRLKGAILVCKVWCYDRKLIEMGIDTNEWLDFAIDLKQVIAIKINGEGTTESEKEAEGKSTLYMAQDAFTVDVDFKELYPEWIRIKNRV